jgi:non-heme chloroperoxidase
MTIRLAHLLFMVSLVLGANAHAQARPDTTPHKVQFVTVDKSVRVEVVDWGGTGRPMLFLPGGGGTAHNFDSFAPRFTANHHVYGMTRRGAGASSAPPPVLGAYAADRLGEDVLAVIAALSLDRPVLVGWSIAGGELSFMGSKHPEKVRGLIYLDAAYSYAFYDPAKGNLLIDANDLQNKLDRLIALNGPELVGPTDPSTPALLQDLRDTLPRLEKDLKYWQTMMRTLPPAGPQEPNASINSAILRGAQKNGEIKSPILAVFAVPHTWPIIGGAADHAAMEAEDAAWGNEVANAFQKGNPTARVVRLKNADHELWATHEADVEREMNSFMTTLR